MCEKRWVFRTDLNVAKDGIFLISIGREFQSTGTDAEKAWLPYVHRRRKRGAEGAVAPQRKLGGGAKRVFAPPPLNVPP